MKILTIFVIILMVFCGCGQKPAPKEAPKQEVPAETALASYSTDILDSAENRMHNIRLCCDAINGVTLKPGEVFSFNGIVGERSAEKGYKKARVMVKDEYIEDFGGGVCQVSTTIFGAVKKAGLEVVEHHTHNHPVAYEKKGNDAAVNYPNLDFKFKNTKNVTIIIKINQNSGKVFANIVHIL